MHKLALSWLVVLTLVTRAFAWPTVFPTGTTVLNPAKADNGYVLYSPIESAAGGGTGVMYLIDLRGKIVHEWSVPFSPLYGRLLPNGHVVIIGRNDKDAPDRPGIGKYEIGGVAGWLVELDWDGKLVNKHVDLAMHHDFDRLPNGNTIYLAWEPVSKDLRSKIRGGLKGTEFADGMIFNDKIVEIDPQGKVVWEWHANNHFDPDVDIIGPIYKRQEWYHGNSIAAISGDKIAITGRYTDTLMIIDRKSGEIVRRWGSPSYLDMDTGRIEYRAGKDFLGGAHDVREIPAGFPGAGHLTCYDNGVYISSSRVVEIDPVNGALVWQSPHETLGRKQYSDFISGAQRLRSGNTFVCDGANGRLLQITKSGEIVWEFVNPITPSPKYQGAIFKAQFYEPGYAEQLNTLAH